MAHCIFRQLQRTSKPIILLHHQNKTKPIINTIINNLNNSCYYTPKRTLISQLHNDTFKSKLVRLLRNQLQYAMENSPPSPPVPEFNSFDVDERPTERWVKLTRKFKENEEINLEVGMFDASMTVNKPGAAEESVEDVLLHVSMLVSISKGEGNDVLEFACSVWPDSIEIHKVYTRKGKRTGQLYMGPGFQDLDDDFQDSLYEFLEERGIDEELTTFLHKYMKNKEQNEHVRSVERVKSFIESK